MGSLPHNEPYLLAHQNGSPANVLEASMRSITPQVNGKSSSDDFEQLIRNMSQVGMSSGNHEMWITDYVEDENICMFI